MTSRSLLCLLPLSLLASCGWWSEGDRDGRRRRGPGPDEAPAAKADARKTPAKAERRNPRPEAPDRDDPSFEERAWFLRDLPDDVPETVVFVVMDTVRADHMSLCGYERPTTPFLSNLVDELGASATCRAYSPASWTLPSHTSYFTGLSVSDHGHDLLGGKLPPAGEFPPLLAETLSERGYQTAMFAANTALRKSGLQRGFEHVEIAEDMTAFREPRLPKAFGTFLERLDPEQPLFLFVNLIDAHDPYSPVPKGLGWAPPQPVIPLDVNDPEEDAPYHRFLRGEMDPVGAKSFLRRLTNGYDYGIWQEDRNIRHVLTGLRRAGRLPGPLRLVVTSDHGEFLGEHQLLRHNAYVWEPVVHVPLVYFDNRLDIQPELPEPVSAVSAYHLVKDGTLPSPALPVRSHARAMPNRPVTPGEDMVAQWHADAPKLIWWEGRYLSVDLSTDPDELAPTPGDDHPDHAPLASEVEHYLEHLESTKRRERDPEALESLRALGYVE